MRSQLEVVAGSPAEAVLSTAARAFKTHALRASGSDAAVEESETFRPTDQRWGSTRSTRRPQHKFADV